MVGVRVSVRARGAVMEVHLRIRARFNVMVTVMVFVVNIVNGILLRLGVTIC